MKLIDGLLDLFFPPRRVCPLCGSPEGQNCICSGCLLKFDEYRREPACLKCGRFFQPPPEGGCLPGGDEDLLCRDCSRGGRFFSLARAAGPYEGDLKEAVLRLKYTGQKVLAAHLSELMFQSLENNHLIMAQVLTAVPLSPERLRQRGFNQSELLAFGLAEKMKIPLLPVLRKVRETPSQTGLDRAGREENLVGAFALTDPGAVRGKTVILVDDVITTGNTLNNVSGVLAGGGAAAVICVAAAAGRTYLDFSGAKP